VKRGLCALACAALLDAVGAAPVTAEPAARAESGPQLARSPLADLIGSWKATGQVGQKPVAYEARAEWVLGGSFLRLTLTDVATPPAYQAEVYIGWDDVSERYVCHWLDGFGARSSETLGYGVFAGDALTLVFEYPSGPFHTKFQRLEGGRWEVTMRGKDGNGPWLPFASYAFSRSQ